MSSLPRARGASLSGDAMGAGRGVPLFFLLGWGLLCAAETFGRMEAPSVPLCLAAVAGLVAGSEVGFWTGLTVGCAGDLLSGLPLGSQGFAAGLVGGALGGMARSISPGAWGAPLVLLALLAAPYRWLVQALARIGGIGIEGPGIGELAGLVTWDCGLGLLLFLGLRWAGAGRQ